VRPEHVLFYDFVTAAARVVLADPTLAQTIGKQTKPIGGSRQSNNGNRRGARWLRLQGAAVVSAAVLVIGFGVGWWSTLH